VALSHWFSNRERGTRYGVWSTCHSIGEALTFLVTASLVAWLGWRWGFWGPGILGLLAALVLYRTLADRPQTYGLPHISEYKQDFTGVKVEGGGKPTARAQLAVLKNPYIWLLGLASASIYMARYGMNNWGVLYLQEVKGYDLATAGAVMGTYPLLGLAGAAVSGWFSDRFFGARRNMPALLFGLLELGSLVALFMIPPELRWADTIALGCFGFALGGLLVYLGGLMAVDLSARDAAGAAMGVVGMFSYLGAALQDTVSGMLLDADASTLDGVTTYDFGNVQLFWVGASVVSILLAACTWPAYRKI
jgi:OPA family sugar phosphate sensor protein UhpC-like MFS transporter